MFTEPLSHARQCLGPFCIYQASCFTPRQQQEVRQASFCCCTDEDMEGQKGLVTSQRLHSEARAGIWGSGLFGLKACVPLASQAACKGSSRWFVQRLEGHRGGGEGHRQGGWRTSKTILSLFTIFQKVVPALGCPDVWSQGKPLRQGLDAWIVNSQGWREVAQVASSPDLAGVFKWTTHADPQLSITCLRPQACCVHLSNRKEASVLSMVLESSRPCFI